MARPGFVGRESERTTLEERLRVALEGEGQVVLIAGEPGVGKTRLGEEAASRARELGLAVATGRATEDEGSPPYWPFLQIFRALGREPPAEMSPRDADATVSGGGSPQQRFRLFEAATDALVAEAEPSGLLITLDDLQWADSASVRLLAHLSMALARSRMMVLVTYRDTETAGQEPLRATVTALAREPTVTRMRLAGLTESEVAAHLAGVTGWEVPASVAVAVCRRTQGNPSFVGELGRLFASSLHGQLPDGVRDAVRDRLTRLSTSCRDVVSAAAVLGSEVDPAALASAIGMELDEVLTALDEAAVAGIVGGADGRRFGHDLIRESARLELPTAERRALHRRMADYLTGRGDAHARVAEVAFHRLESLPAGDAAQAVAWAEGAAERAMARRSQAMVTSNRSRKVRVGGCPAPGQR